MSRPTESSPPAASDRAVYPATRPSHCGGFAWCVGACKYGILASHICHTKQQ